jgi:hypothetical protein
MRSLFAHEDDLLTAKTAFEEIGDSAGDQLNRAVGGVDPDKLGELLRFDPIYHSHNSPLGSYTPE